MTEAQQIPVSFEAIYAEEFDFVWNKLRLLGVNQCDLEDYAHDVFVVVHKRLADFDATRAVRPWLFGIAYRVVVGKRRRFQSTREVVQPHVAIAPQPSPESQTLARENAVRVQQALAKIPLERQVVLLMHEVDGYAVPDIATALEVPLNTAYSRLRLARRDLKAEMERLMAQAGEQP